MDGKLPSYKKISGPTKTGAKNNRKKRSATNEEPKYGCPKGFEKLSEYMCVHMRRDTNERAIPSSFSDSKKYCEDKGSGASLLYFRNPTDAFKVWKWLGK